MADIDLEQSRRLYVALLEQSLYSIVEKLKERPDVLRVSVFGSYARGRADLFTDLDVLVIMQTEMPFPERQRTVYQLLASPVDLDILCYTSEEFESMRYRPFLRHALRDERLLYEKKPA
jgi:predicted nucleotidyltransferase